ESSAPFEISAYHFEAAIASLHAVAPDFEKTDWKSIHHLYEMLYELQPNPVVAMNKAIASSYAISKQHALNELQQISGLEHHYLYFATLGELYLAFAQKEKAKEHFLRAIQLTTSASEKQLLKSKINSCSEGC
ncbi:MAG TPA: hypothetical protein VHM26_06600, partial [Chitinophagaceae bacterium]|nr:hypothetical protein [Chitinophagaceae bacterium]